MKIVDREEAVDLASYAGKEITLLLKEFKEFPILLLLSGGSSMKILPHIKLSTKGSRMTISMLDERWSKDPTENNFSQLMETSFYKNSTRLGCQYIDTRVGIEKTVEEAGEIYNGSLYRWIKDNPDGKIIANVGMGSDGHIAGIMPFPDNPEYFEKAFNDDKIFAIGYNTKGKSQFLYRFSVTLSFMKNHFDATVSLIIGKEKELMLQKALSGQGKLSEVPAGIFRTLPRFSLFTNSSLL